MSTTLLHYTPVFSAVMILRDGVIRRSSEKAPPYVWLSSNPIDEPTAGRIRPGWLPPPILDDPRAFFAFQGWARFGVPGGQRHKRHPLARPAADPRRPL
jgi:hypothetical protein